MKYKYEAKAVLSDQLAAPFFGIPEQGVDTPEEERLKPGDAVFLVGQEDVAMNGPWFISEGPWSRDCADAEEATGRVLIQQMRDT